MIFKPRTFNKYPAHREPTKPPLVRSCVVFADPTGAIGYAPTRADMPADAREIAQGLAPTMRKTVETHARRFNGPDGAMYFVPTVHKSTHDDEETASLVAFRQKFR